MTFLDGVLAVDSFLTFTVAIMVLFLGKRINAAVAILREFSIPEPVTGGLLCSLAIALAYVLTGVAVDFNLDTRNILLVYFFTTIGINASLGDLRSGGRPLIVLLAVMVGYMVVQDLAGVSFASAIGLEPAIGLLGGTVRTGGRARHRDRLGPEDRRERRNRQRGGDWRRLRHAWAGARERARWATREVAHHAAPAAARPRQRPRPGATRRAATGDHRPHGLPWGDARHARVHRARLLHKRVADGARSAAAALCHLSVRRHRHHQRCCREGCRNSPVLRGRAARPPWR